MLRMSTFGGNLVAIIVTMVVEMSEKPNLSHARNEPHELQHNLLYDTAEGWTTNMATILTEFNWI